MRYALGLVVWLLATSGLLAADQTKSKSTSGTPGPIQLGILVGGKAWDMADFSPDKTDQGFQTAALYTRADEPIIGILLTNPNNYDFEYTCVYRDSLLDNDKTETVKAGQPCPSIPHNTQSLYVKSLSAKFTSEPAGQIKISCALFDPGTPPYTPPPLPLPHSAPPVPPPLTPSCVTATDTQRIVGVQIAVRAPPMLQLGVLAPPGEKWDLAYSLPDIADTKFQTIERHTAANGPIVGIFLKNLNPDYGLQVTCVYEDKSQDILKDPAELRCQKAKEKASLYVRSLKVDFTTKPPGKIKLSCKLFDTESHEITQTNTDAAFPDPPTDCATTKDTQRIISVEIAIQPPSQQQAQQ